MMAEETVVAFSREQRRAWSRVETQENEGAEREAGHQYESDREEQGLSGQAARILSCGGSTGGLGKVREVERFQPDEEGEGAATAWGTLEPDAATHYPDELFADGETEAEAAVTARVGQIGLHEGGEDVGVQFGGNADAGVTDGDFEADAGAFACPDADEDVDLAAVGELDGVVDEVKKDLGEAEGIAVDQRGDLGGDFAGEYELSDAGALFEGIEEGSEAGAEIEAGAGEGDFPGVGIGVIEEVVDEAEEALSGGLDDGEAFAVGV